MEENKKEENKKEENKKEENKKEENKFLQPSDTEKIKKQQDAENAEKKINQSTEAALKKLADLPKEITAELNNLKNMLLDILAGEKDPNDPGYDPKKIIEDLKKIIESILQPLTNLLGSATSLSGVKLEIPGLSALTKIFDSLSQMTSKFTKSEYESSNPGVKWSSLKPEIPKELLNIIEDLIKAIQTILSQLPMCLINILFSLIKGLTDIIVQLMDFVGAGDLEPIDKVNDIIANLPKLIPEIFKLITNGAVKAKNICTSIIKEKVEVMEKSQFPEQPQKLPDVKLKPSCPDDLAKDVEIKKDQNIVSNNKEKNK